jgi:CRISPR/Cas system-associated exonuclease Cas4 (RecB family)
MRFQLNGEKITIVGHVDAYDPETATIYDVKTSRFVTWQSEKGFIPRENHTAQIQCYSTLLEQYRIEVSRLVLVYVDDQTILAKQVPRGNRRDWMIRRATILHRAFQTSAVPEPEVAVSCAYCPFIELCPRNSEAILFPDKPKANLHQAGTGEVF